MENNILIVENISKAFFVNGKKQIALDDISFSLKAKDVVLVAGANGSGKTLLMSIIAKLDKADSGKITIIDNNKKTKCAIVFQDANTQILGESPFEDVLFSLKNLSLSKVDAEKRAKEILKEVGLEEKMFFPARFLSGGEKRKLAVATSLALNLPLIIFDEPYANLDYEGVKQVNEIINLLKEKGKTIIILTHEIEKSLALCNRFIILYKGKKVFDGSIEDGIKQNLEKYAIRNPLVSYKKVGDLKW